MAAVFERLKMYSGYVAVSEVQIADTGKKREKRVPIRLGYNGRGRWQETPAALFWRGSLYSIFNWCCLSSTPQGATRGEDLLTLVLRHRCVCCTA